MPRQLPRQCVRRLVEYSYDYLDRRIRKVLDDDGSVGANTPQYYYNVYQGDNAVLEIHDGNGLATGGQDPEDSAHREHRYLYGPAVDEILASENTGQPGNSGGLTLWGLGDQEGTIRDVVNGTTRAVVENRKYKSFGQAASMWTVDFIFGYTGQAFEAYAGLYDYGHRWYDPMVGRFASADPTGFDAGDMNLFRYVGNNPLNMIDPTGLCGISTTADSYLADAGLWGGGSRYAGPVYSGLGSSSSFANPYYGSLSGGAPSIQSLLSSSSDFSTGYSSSLLFDSGFSPFSGSSILDNSWSSDFSTYSSGLNLSNDNYGAGAYGPSPQAYGSNSSRNSAIKADRDITMQVADMLEKHWTPPADVGTPTRQQLEKVGEIVQMRYEGFVGQFKETHPGAKPGLDSRYPWQSAEDAPWCADWANGTRDALVDYTWRSQTVPIGNSKLPLSKIIMFSYAQSHRLTPWYNALDDVYQHNFVLAYPAGYTHLPQSNLTRIEYLENLVY